MLQRQSGSKTKLYEKMSLGSDFYFNGRCAIDPHKLHRAPKIIVALDRIQIERPEEADFIPVPVYMRKRKRSPRRMMPNPNRERGFRLSDKV